MKRLFIRNAQELATFLGFNKSLPVVYHSFVFNEEWPLILDPMLDAHLIHLGVLWGYRCNGSVTVLSTPLLPNALENHLRPLGFDPDLVEVQTEIGRWGAINEIVPSFDKRLLFAPFVTSELLHVGEPLYSSQVSQEANSKVVMRQSAEKFNFPMLPSRTVVTVNDCRIVARELSFPLWIKADGSGGDFNRRVKEAAELEDAICDIAKRVFKGWNTLPEGCLSFTAKRRQKEWQWAFQHATHLPNWLELPVQMIMEVDAARIGKLVANVCWQFVIGEQQTWELGCSEQLFGFDASEWWGSTSDTRFHSGHSAYAEALESAFALCEWFRSLGVRGLVGPDIFVIEDFSGKYQVYWVDPNGRPAVSSTPFMIQNALFGGEGDWININLTLPRAVSSFEEVEEIIGQRLLSPEGEDGVNAIMMTSRWRPDVPSPIVKMLFLSRQGVSICKSTLQRLQEKGIQIGS